MKLIIAGSRTFDELDWYFIRATTHQFDIYPTEIVSGKAKGVDSIGEEYADMNNLPIKPFEVTKKDWNEKGLAAGPIRNKQMAEYADVLLLIWDGESRGSANMKKEMLALNKPVYEIVFRKYNETK